MGRVKNRESSWAICWITGRGRWSRLEVWFVLSCNEKVERRIAWDRDHNQLLLSRKDSWTVEEVKLIKLNCSIFLNSRKTLHQISSVVMSDDTKQSHDFFHPLIMEMN